MSCCFGQDTDGVEPKKLESDQSDASTNKPIIPVNKPKNDKIQYSITVKTGDFRTSGTNGPVYINIFGRDDKQTGNVLLSGSNRPFTQSSTRKFEINAIDIGKPQRIIIQHEDKSTGWYVDYVEISVHNFLIRFVANRWLNQLKNDRRLDMELFGSEQPAVMYNVEVQTGDEQIEPLDSPVYMQIYGTTTTTPKLFLESKNASFTKGSTSKFIVSSNNVGEIQRIVIGHEGLGTVKDWHLKSIKVEMLSQKQEYVVDKWLSPTQGNQQLFVELPEEKPSSPTLPPKYLINIKTADVMQNKTTENVEMIVRGSDGQIARILLKDYAKLNSTQLFQQGNLDQFEIEHQDIGTIDNITIGFSGIEQNASWLLEYIDIQYNEIIYHFRAHCWLSNRLGPNLSWTTLKPAGNNDDIHYKILIETGQSGIDANVILCIFGEEETTNNLPLVTTKEGSPAKFEKHSNLEFDLEAPDVGKIKKINIGHDGKGSEHQWFLKAVQIEKTTEKYHFNANRWLSDEKDDQKTFIDLTPEQHKTPSSSPVLKKDQSMYKIIVVTSSEENAGTDSGVLMTISGDKDITKQFQLIDTKHGHQTAFETGKTNEFEMELDDVGKINQINIGQDGNGSHPQWHLESVQIQKGSEKYHFLANKILDQSTPFADLTPIPPKKTPSPEPVRGKTPTSVRSKAKTPTSVHSKTKTPTPIPVKAQTPQPATPELKSPLIKEATYKISIQPDPHKNEDLNIYMLIHGENGQTKKLFLKDSKTTEYEFKTIDVGKISKIVLGQENTENQVSWRIDNLTIKRNHETTTFNVEQTIQPNSEIDLSPSAIPKKIESTYKILVQTGASQEEGDNSNLTITLFGQNGQTKAIPLDKNTRTNKKVPFKKDEKIEFESKSHDVGKISKIILQQNSTEQGILWHIHNLTIKRNNDIATFNVDRKLEQNSPLELIPSPLLKKSETPRKTPKTSETISKIVVKTKDTDYAISISTGDQSLDAPVTLKIRGDYGIVSIPLTKTKTNAKPFQAKASDEFTCRTTDVGKIRRVMIEHQGTDENIIWHIKSVQIKKENETYNFIADVRLDYKENRVNLYPVGAFLGHQKEDYVQNELRRLRESLRAESAKLRPPQHKAYEPFVYNDLRPYFDTSPVERAIYTPSEAPPGYYTRVTALRVVEPWEAHGMDYGVSYELLKARKSRSSSTKRTPSKTEDEAIDRKQGSTHLPKFPCVNMHKPAEYARPLNMNDVPKIRSFIRSRYTAQAGQQVEKDYKRTHDDFYRMQLDNITGYHQSNRDNMLQVYHSYLENTPGSKKAVRELCDRIAVNNTKSSVETTV